MASSSLALLEITKIETAKDPEAAKMAAKEAAATVKAA